MTNSKLIKGIVFFDIDDTLFDATGFVNYAREQSFNSMIEAGLNTNIATLKEIFPQIYNKLGANSTIHYNVLLEELGSNQNEIDRLVAKGVISYHNAKRHLGNYRSSNLVRLLNYLQKKYILGIISSGVPSKQWEKLCRLDIDDYFNSQNVYIVEDKNTQKDSNLYLSILNNYKSQFATGFDFIMIGDREDRDIIPAKDAGFKTIRYRGEGKYNGNFENSVADFKITNFKQIIDQEIL